MSLRDKPRLSDRLRGKSGDELINEIKKEFEDSKETWFNPGSPRFSSFRRDGFPFDEDVFNRKNDAGIKSHLEDLAKKHPEFAGDLRCPPWGGSVGNQNWEKAYTVPIKVEKSEFYDPGAAASPSFSQNRSSPSAENPFQSESSVDGSLGQHGLRNTVDIAEQIQIANQRNAEAEPKRSSSAPPNSSSVQKDKEPKRFTSKIEITPINPFERTPSNMSSGEGSSTVPTDDQRASSGIRHVPVTTEQLPSSSQDLVEPTSPQQTSQLNASSASAHHIPPVGAAEGTQNSNYHSAQTNRQHQQQQQQKPQVHHIPIFVEGRNEPIVPKKIVEEVLVEQRSYAPDQTPLKRKLDGSGADGGATFTTSSVPSTQNPIPSSTHERKVPAEASAAAATQSTPTPPSSRICPPPPPPPPPPPVIRPDPMQCVQHVQQEVNGLTSRIEQFSCTSRNDKEYMYLDEMLTRNLIKLDTIEVEGNESLRAARKVVIKSIQKSIALLESKVAVVENLPNEDVKEQNQKVPVATNAADNAAPFSNGATVMEVDTNGAARGDEIGNRTN